MNLEQKCVCGCTCECSCFCCAPQIGDKAPDFVLDGYFQGAKKKFALKDFQGKWVLLFFYPLDFTFVCPTELRELSQRQAEFAELNTQILGVSVDSVYAHEAWLKELGDFNYPLLSDLTKEVSRKYHVLLPKEGIALRGAFLISPDGVLKSYMVNDNSVGRSVAELLRLVTALQTGELCPVGWQKGQQTLGKT